MDVKVLDCFEEKFDAETALMRNMDDPYVNEYFCKEDKCNKDFPDETVSMRLKQRSNIQTRISIFSID